MKKAAVEQIERKIQTARDYGHINLRLRERMEELGLNRNQVATAAGTRFEVIDKWCKGSGERIDADILARLCYVLGCNVEDIVTYEKD